MEEEVEEVKRMYEVEEGERFYLRRSKSGKGIYITNERVTFGLRGNIEHLQRVLSRGKEFTTLEVRVKETQE